VNHELIENLYKGAHLAFISTTFWGDEVAIGRALADAGKDFPYLSPIRWPSSFPSPNHPQITRHLKSQVEESSAN
jgi:hypothetical protein